jgi:hypothetical protein
MATKKRKRFAEGGISEAEDKAAGLKASEGDKVGFFERLRMGNIDQEGSEAYNRFGAGRGKAERSKANQSTSGEVSPNVYRVDSGPGAMADEDKPSTDVYRVDSGPGKMSSGASKPSPARKPAAAASQPTKGSSAYRVDSGPGSMGTSYSNEGRSSKTAKVDTSNYSNEGRGRQLSLEQQYARAEAEARTPEGKAKRKQQEEAQGLERVTPETALMPGGGLKALSGLAKKLATPKMATYTQPALAAPTKRLPYDKAGAVTRAREARAAARQEEMLKENAARYGLDPKAPGYEAAAGAIRKDLGGKDFSFKRGGKVKAKAPMKKMASGGSTSKASSRADGIAQRGKTRGKIY